MFRCIIRPVISVSALTCFIRYVYYWNLQFENNVIIIKIKVLIPQTWVTLAEFAYAVYVLSFSISKSQKLFVFSIPFEYTGWRLFQKRAMCIKLDSHLSRDRSWFCLFTSFRFPKLLGLLIFLNIPDEDYSRNASFLIYICIYF